MPITYNIIFDLNDTVVRFEDTTDYSGYTGAIHGVLTLTAGGTTVVTPGNNSYPHLTIPTTDHLPASPLQSSRVLEVALPSPVNGEWFLAYDIYPNAGADPVESAASNLFTYDYSPIIASTSITVSMLASQITSVDSTDYTVGGLYTVNSITRSHEIIAPPGAVTGAGVNIPYPASSGSVTSISYTGITTGMWQSLVSSTVELDKGLFKVIDTITGVSSAEVNSVLGLCNVYCCLKQLNDRYEDAKCKNKVLADEYKEKIEDVVRLISLYDQSIICGIEGDAEGYMNEIQSISECDTDCNCYGDGDIPANIPITCGVSSNSYTLSAASNRIIVTSTGSGSSSDPVAYVIDIGTEVIGNISYITNNFNSATTAISEINTDINDLSTTINGLQDGVTSAFYAVKMPLTIPTPNSQGAITTLFLSGSVFNASATFSAPGITVPGYPHIDTLFGVDNILSSGPNSFIVIPSLNLPGGLSVHVMNLNTTGAFEFEILQNGNPVTYNWLATNSPGLEINFKIISI